jgi:hypothetical protein
MSIDTAKIASFFPNSMPEATQNVLSHELGHTLGLDDVSYGVFSCSQVVSVMYVPANQAILCGVLTPQTPCDLHTFQTEYPPTWFISPYYPCPYCRFGSCS